jgi:O-antigen/teichoic acid export membrane protein
LFVALVNVVSLPIITSIYGPGTYAQFALVLAVSSLLATAVSGRYEVGVIVLPHSAEGDGEAWKLARLATILTLLVTVLLQLISFIAVALGLGSGNYGNVAILLTPLATGLTAVSAIQTMMDSRRSRFQVISLLQIARVVILLGLQIGLGFYSPSAASLVIPLLLAGVPSAVRLTWLMSRFKSGSEFTYVQLAARHNRYPKFQVPAALANSMSVNAFTLGLAVAYGDISVGLFAVASRIVFFPSSLINLPINTVYLREASRVAGERSKARSYYQKTMLFLLVSGTLCFAVLALAIGPLTSLLGPDWTQAKDMTVAIIPLGLASFAGTLPNSALISYGRQKDLLFWRLVLALSAPVILLLGPALDLTYLESSALASWCVLFLSIVYSYWGVRIIRSAPLPPEFSGAKL